MGVTMGVSTLPETNRSRPPRSWAPQRKRLCSNHPFSGGEVLVSGRVQTSSWLSIPTCVCVCLCLFSFSIDPLDKKNGTPRISSNVKKKKEHHQKWPGIFCLASCMLYLKIQMKIPHFFWFPEKEKKDLNPWALLCWRGWRRFFYLPDSSLFRALALRNAHGKFRCGNLWKSRRGRYRYLVAHGSY